MRIRRYIDADHGEVTALHQVALRAAGAYDKSGRWDADLDDIHGVYLDSGGEFLVGVVDGAVAAMGAIRPLATHSCEFKRMRVLPGLQRHGYGQTMLTRLLERAVELGFTTAVLDTTVRQEAAIRLYMRNGFVESHRDTVVGMETIFFRRTLHP